MTQDVLQLLFLGMLSDYVLAKGLQGVLIAFKPDFSPMKKRIPIAQPSKFVPVVADEYDRAPLFAALIQPGKNLFLGCKINPAVGSSSRITDGSCSTPAHRLTFRFHPPDSRLTLCFHTSRKPNTRINSSL